MAHFGTPPSRSTSEPNISSKTDNGDHPLFGKQHSFLLSNPEINESPIYKDTWMPQAADQDPKNMDEYLWENFQQNDHGSKGYCKLTMETTGDANQLQEIINSSIFAVYCNFLATKEATHTHLAYLNSNDLPKQIFMEQDQAATHANQPEDIPKKKPPRPPTPFSRRQLSDDD